MRRVTSRIAELPPGSFKTPSNEADDQRGMIEARKLLNDLTVPESR